MDRSLQLVQHIYEDSLSREELEDLLQDEQLAEEYRSMMAVKKLLDRRELVSPDETVITAVLEKAASYGPVHKKQSVIQPIRLLKSPVFRWAAAACVALIGFTAVWFYQSSQMIGDSATSENLVGTKSFEQADSENQPENILRWDDGQDLMLIQERINWLESRSEGNDWGEAPTPLEMLPNNSGTQRNSELHPVDQR